MSKTLSKDGEACGYICKVDYRVFRDALMEQAQGELSDDKIERLYNKLDEPDLVALNAPYGFSLAQGEAIYLPMGMHIHTSKDGWSFRVTRLIKGTTVRHFVREDEHLFIRLTNLGRTPLDVDAGEPVAFITVSTGRTACPRS